MTDQRITEESLRQDLQRWAEAGAPTIDLGAALAKRTRANRNRWRRWGSVVATLLLLSTAATVTFPAWAASAADWPLIGAPIKAYLAERAGLSWAYEMGFFQSNLAELSDGGVTVRVLGVLADPVQTKVFYQVQGLNPNAQPATPAGEERPRFPAEVHITGINGVGGVNSTYPISDFDAPVQYYITETTPIPGESALLNLRLQVGDAVKTLDLPVSLADSRPFFTELPVGESQSHGPITITVERLTLSPAEVVVTYKTDGLPGPSGGWSARGPLPEPYLRSAGKELEGRPVAGFGIGGRSNLGFARIKGQAQLVIPTATTPTAVNAQWAWAPGATTSVEGVPVKLESIRPAGDEVSVQWTYPADSALLGLGGFTLIGQDGARLPLDQISGSGAGADEKVAHAFLSVKLPSGFEPAAVAVTHAVMRIDGPWVFDLPALPAKP